MALNPAAPWSVGSLARALSQALWERFGVVTVQGEISGFTRAASGHCYFSLRDANAQLRCVMFRQRASLVDFELRDGLRVELRAEPGLYEPRGDLQLIVESVRRFGQGALMEQFLRLKARLQEEGVFDPARKRELPRFARSVGIVTSPQAAALRDVLVTLRRRSPQLRVVIYPASVQGAAAPAELVRALRAAQARAEVDVLLLVRGGGSLEDLWAFNDEALARTIASCSLPVISGVGHETDFTIADFAADLRAPTPTAAAELCAVSLDDLQGALRQSARTLRHAMQVRLAREQQRLDRMQLRLPPPARVLGTAGLRLRDLGSRLRHAVAAGAQARQRRLELAQSRLRVQLPQQLQRRRAALDEQARRLPAALRAQLLAQRRQLASLQARLHALDPAATLQRGYCLAWRADGSLLQEAAELQGGQDFVLATAHSAARLRVQSAGSVEHPLDMLRTDAGESS